MEFRLLGPLEVLDNGRPVALGAGKRRALLALLLLHRGEFVAAERLIHELWGERPPSTAAKSVHVYVSQLRRELHVDADDAVILTRGAGYAVAVGPESLDTHRFEEALSAGESALADGDAAGAAERLREGLALWRGPPLADFTYEPFAQGAIARLAELRVAALETRIEADLALGRHAHVVGELDALVREEPLREGFRRLLMLALYRCGRQADALDTYRAGRALLVAELGLEPGPALRELEERILAQDPDLAPPEVPRRVRRAPPPVHPAPKPGPRALRNAALLLVPGAVLLAAATLALRSSDDPSPAGANLGRASTELVGVDPTGRPRTAVPLPGRAVDLAFGDDRVWAATVDSESITVVDPATGEIDRTVPLRIRPDALALGLGGVWAADASRRLLVRIAAGYQEVTARIVLGRPPRRPPEPRGGRALAPRLGMAIAGGAVWVADGGDGLLRVDPRTRRVVRVARGRRIDAVAAGAGAVWATGSATGAVVRIEPSDGRVSARTRLAGRRVARAPFPVGVAAADGAVWTLNGNSATLTRIDPRTVGVVASVELGLDRAPAAVAADARGAWVANGDGTVSRVDAITGRLTSLTVGEALRDITTDGTRLWVANAAVDHHVPGGIE